MIVQGKGDRFACCDYNGALLGRTAVLSALRQQSSAGRCQKKYLTMTILLVRISYYSKQSLSRTRCGLIVVLYRS